MANTIQKRTEGRKAPSWRSNAPPACWFHPRGTRSPCTPPLLNRRLRRRCGRPVALPPSRARCKCYEGDLTPSNMMRNAAIEDPSHQGCSADRSGHGDCCRSWSSGEWRVVREGPLARLHQRGQRAATGRSRSQKVARYTRPGVETARQHAGAEPEGHYIERYSHTGGGTNLHQLQQEQPRPSDASFDDIWSQSGSLGISN
jgi:hypothetical protein